VRWYTVGISIFCLVALAAGGLDLKQKPDLTQGLGLFNYWMCLVGTLMGTWLGLWALVHVIKAKKPRDAWKECAKNCTKSGKG
jgi:hypothetical protein